MRMNIGNIFMSMMNDCRGFEDQIQSKLKFVEIINSKDDSYHNVKEEIKFQDLMREYFTLPCICLPIIKLSVKTILRGFDKTHFHFISLDTRSDHRIAIVQRLRLVRV